MGISYKNESEFVITGSDKSNNSSHSIGIDTVYENINQVIIITTEDKLKLCLRDHILCVEKNKDWIAPLSTFISFVLALISSDFKDFVFLKTTWLFIFETFSVLSFVWFLVSLRYVFQKRTIEMLISDIKAKPNH